MYDAENVEFKFCRLRRHPKLTNMTLPFMSNQQFNCPVSFADFVIFKPLQQLSQERFFEVAFFSSFDAFF